ncbi:MAG: hypothetical protein ONB05_08105 [candidate division KSB1 bacterium]|nr:hypothetical protein [candidate division KSB1 bacterium]
MRLKLDSDIDLAVLGIPNELFWKALAEVIWLDQDFSIAVVALEDCRGYLKESIEKYGELL